MFETTLLAQEVICSLQHLHVFIVQLSSTCNSSIYGIGYLLPAIYVQLFDELIVSDQQTSSPPTLLYNVTIILGNVMRPIN